MGPERLHPLQPRVAAHARWQWGLILALPALLGTVHGVSVRSPIPCEGGKAEYGIANCLQYMQLPVATKCNVASESLGMEFSELMALNPGLCCEYIAANTKLCVQQPRCLATVILSPASGSTCSTLQADEVRGLNEAQLTLLNPGINCQALASNTELCLERAKLDEDIAGSRVLPTDECQYPYERYVMQEGDTCESIATARQFTVAQMQKEHDCAAVRPGVEYCVPASEANVKMLVNVALVNNTLLEPYPNATMPTNTSALPNATATATNTITTTLLVNGTLTTSTMVSTIVTTTTTIANPPATTAPSPTVSPTVAAGTTRAPRDDPPPAVGSSGGGGGGDEGSLAAHNLERRMVGAGIPDLVWDGDLAAQATRYSEVLAGRGCVLEHAAKEQREGQGENLYQYESTGRFGNSDITLATAVKAWNDEKNDWTYGSGVFNHYTQVMWRSTSRVGCGRAYGKGATYPYCVVITCRYKEPGNWAGQNPW